MLLLAITIPGLSMLLNGRIISGLIAIILQVVAIFTSALFGAGVVLWILLVIWAVNIRSNVKNNRKLKEIEKKINSSRELNNENPINESKTEFLSLKSMLDRGVISEEVFIQETDRLFEKKEIVNSQEQNITLDKKHFNFFKNIEIVIVLIFIIFGVLLTIYS